jgi:hypothetical protein
VRRVVELALDRKLHGVFELFSVRRKQLDAVVVVRIMRRTDDDAGAAAQLARQLRDGRRGHRPEQAHIGTGGDEARFERGLEHVAGDAGVLADQYCRGHAVAENAADRAAETQHEFRRDRMFARAAANAISAEILFFSHSLQLFESKDQDSPREHESHEEEKSQTFVVVLLLVCDDLRVFVVICTLPGKWVAVTSCAWAGQRS